MNYEQQENDILLQLNSNPELTAVSDCKLLPEALSDYKTPFQKGLVTVVFVGEKYDPNQSIGDVSQYYTATFSLSVQARLLRGTSGVYAISELVKSSIVGFRPLNCDALTLTEHSFAGYQNDVWEHTILFSCKSLRTQVNSYVVPGTNITGDEVVYYDPLKLTINEQIQISG